MPIKGYLVSEHVKVKQILLLTIIPLFFHNLLRMGAAQ
jgi:hypothetical protein